MSPISFLRSARTVGNVLGPFKGGAALLFVLIVLSALSESLSLGMVLPLLQLMVGTESGTGSRYLALILHGVAPGNRLLVVSLLLLGLVGAKSAFTILREYTTLRVVNGLRLYWARAVLDRTVRARFTKVIRKKKGALLNNIVNEPAYAAAAVRDTTEFAAKAVLGALTVTVLALINWRMTALVFAAATLGVLVVWRVSRRYSMNVGKKRVNLNQQVSGAVTDALAGLRQIKLFSMETAVVEDCVGRLSRVVRMLEKFRVVSRLPATLAELFVAALLVAILLVQRYVLGLDLAQVLPLLAVFVIGAQRLFGVVSDLLSLRMTILSHVPSLRLVHAMASQGFEPEGGAAGWDIRELKEGIRFSRVVFGYQEGPPLFAGLDLDLPVGAITALSGPSGVGKSTICDLLIRLLRPQGGKILVDGEDLEAYSLASWRAFVGYVSQESFLFSATVRENIRVGSPQATDGQVERAARLADAHEFILALPQGYDTLVGDSGVGLSGGQRQRIALARALVRDPQVLVLDEATSALDGASERRIFDALRELGRGRVVLLISHRASVLSIADHAYRVARKGEAVEVERAGPADARRRAQSPVS